MTFKVDLVVEGVDILSDEFLEGPISAFEDVEWSLMSGVTLASLYTEGDPVADACTFSRRLEHAGGARVARVFEEFVNVSEIARKIDVSRQTVRNWVEGTRGPGSFPEPDHSHGQAGDKGAMKVWRWAGVNAWLTQLGLDDECEYPSWRQTVEINAHVLRLPDSVSTEWKSATPLRVSVHEFLQVTKWDLSSEVLAAPGLRFVVAAPIASEKERQYRLMRTPGSAAVKGY